MPRSVEIGLTAVLCLWWLPAVFIYPVVRLWRRHHHDPDIEVYDWARQGEADNRSHPRILDPYFDHDEDQARRMFPQ